MRKLSIKKIITLIVITILSVVTAAAVTPVSTALADGAAVDLVLVPGSQMIEAGQSFAIDIQAQCNDQPVDGVQAYLDFDPEFIEVQSILPGNALDTVLQSDYDNQLGTLDFSAGKMTPPFPSANFILATINLKTHIISNTAITLNFHLAEPRNTFVDYGGVNVLRSAINVTINIYVPTSPSPEPPATTTTIPDTATTITSSASATPTLTNHPTTSGTVIPTSTQLSSTSPAPTSSTITVPATTGSATPRIPATSTVSPPTSSPTISTTSPTSTSPPPAASTNWGLVGGIIGGLAALIIVLLALWLTFKKRPGRKT
jgi:hypothetical protein